MTVIWCRRMLINDIYFMSWNKLLQQFLKAVMEGLCMTLDSMTENNCHGFCSRQ